jgi:hypothetical protein
MGLAEILVGGAAAVAVGRSALPRGRGASPAALAEDLVLGIALLVPVALVWGLVGLPWGPVSMPALALTLAALLRPWGWRGSVTPPCARLPEASRARAVAAEALLALCFIVSAWKWTRVRLWAWDHYAIWGLKARRMVQDSALDLEFLDLRAYTSSNPDYPIGLPLTWRFLSPSDPSEAAFKIFHVLFGGALVFALLAAARKLNASRAVAALAAAVVCASPLFWDTEAVGLADLPLACVAVVALLLALEAAADPRFPVWPAGVALGFLGWIKTEGLVLGVLLALACGGLAGVEASGARLRRRAALLWPWLLWSAGALLTRQVLLGRSVGFFEGDWLARARARIPSTGTILSAMLENLSGLDWLGLWIAFGLAIVVGLARKARAAWRLSGVLLAMFGVYLVVYLGTYLDPLRHVESSFHRLGAALAPLAVLAIVASIAAAPDAGPGAPTRTEPEPDGSHFAIERRS